MKATENGDWRKDGNKCRYGICIRNEKYFTTASVINIAMIDIINKIHDRVQRVVPFTLSGANNRSINC